MCAGLCLCVCVRSALSGCVYVRGESGERGYAGVAQTHENMGLLSEASLCMCGRLRVCVGVCVCIYVYIYVCVCVCCVVRSLAACKCAVGAVGGAPGLYRHRRI